MTVWVISGAATLVVLLAVGAVVIYRISRRVGRWSARFMEMRVRFLPPGPRRDAGLLRSRLHAELRATRDMLAAAPQGRIFLADAAAVWGELSTTAAALDAELAAIERFIEPAQQRKALTTITPQVRQLIDTTYSARQTILRTAVEDRTRQMTQLREDVAKQAAALENYQRNGRELSL